MDRESITRGSAHEPGDERHQGQLADSNDRGPLDEFIHEFRDRLKPDGPAVDYAKLYAYLTGALRGEDRDEVEQNLEYATWHDAYWTLQVQRRSMRALLQHDEQDGR